MKEYKNKTSQELHKLIAEKRVALRDFRFGSTGSKTKNVKLGRSVKREIARMMTEISLQRIAGISGSAAKAEVQTKAKHLTKASK